MDKEYIELLGMVEEYGLKDVLCVRYGSTVRTYVSFKERDLKESVDVLALSTRSDNALKRAGIGTLDELYSRIAEGQLRTIRNLGKKSFQEIQVKMLEYGYSRLTEDRKVEFFKRLDEINV